MSMGQVLDAATLMQAVQEVSRLFNELKGALEYVNTVGAAIDKVKQGPAGLPGRKGDNGKDGKGVVHAEVVAEVLKKVPVPVVKDEHLKKVALMVMEQMPKIKGRRGKRGPAGLGADSVDVHAIVAEALKTHKIRPDQVEGFEQTISALRNAGGMRGGGDTVAAGTNITITYSNGKAVINSTGGGGASVATEELAPTASGSDITLDLTGLTHPFVAILGVWKNGQLLTKSDATFGWSRSSNTITVLNAADTDQFQVQYTYA